MFRKISFVIPKRLPVLIFLFHLSPLFQCAPISSQPPPVYVPGPSGRGTISLVSGCILTLFLCVCTAIHLNVFPAGTPWWSRYLHKFGWAVLGMFGPEIILWRAITELGVALRLRKERNEILRQQSRDTQSHDGFGGTEVVRKEQTPWRVAHGFLAVMGGMVVSVKDEYRGLFDEGFTLTPQGVLFLAKLNLLPDLDRNKITAKSKADQLAKGLVCFQAVWMIIQSIARRIDGLPVTLLELNTLAHVLCATFMYGIWWWKPQNVNDPLEIALEPELAAFMTSVALLQDFEPRSLQDSRFQPADAQMNSQILREAGWQTVLPPNTSKYKVIGLPANRWCVVDATTKGLVDKERRPYGVVMLLPGQSLEGIGFALRSTRSDSNYAYHAPESRPKHLTKADIQKLEFLTSPEGEKLLNDTGLSSSSQNNFFHKASNLYIPGDFEKRLSYQTVSLFAVLGFAYGGVHAASWTGHFPSEFEKMMWRAAVCTVAGGCFVILVLVYVLQPVWRGDEGIGENVFSWAEDVDLLEFGVCYLPCMCVGCLATAMIPILVAVAAVTLAAVLIAYIVARVFLVVEAFISIRSLPSGAYDTVAWVNVLPHIGG